MCACGGAICVVLQYFILVVALCVRVCGSCVCVCVCVCVWLWW